MTSSTTGWPNFSNESIDHVLTSSYINLCCNLAMNVIFKRFEFESKASSVTMNFHEIVFFGVNQEQKESKRHYM